MAAETWYIEQVLEQESHRGVQYEVSLRRPDGIRVGRFFDDDTLEFRAAEYGIDPDTEMDLLIEVVLYEFHIPDPTLPSNFEKDAAARAGKMSASTRAWGTRVSMGDPVPTWLFNARTTEQAREAHLLRVEEAKQRIKFLADPLKRSVGKASDPLDVIRNNAVLNRGVIQAKAKHVRQQVDKHIKAAEAIQARSQVMGTSSRLVRRQLPPSGETPQDAAARARAEAYKNREE